MPHEELESVERICFQVEEAQWFYEDFIRPLDPSLPSLPLRAFSLRIFRRCPLFASWNEHHYEAAFEEFIAYKTRVPVRGAIMLSSTMDEVLLVKGWKKGANWSFPRGKINKDERDLDCAVREVYEETGFDVRAAGLVRDEKRMKYIDITMREQQMRLYVFRGVPKDAHFEPKTRKEISKIEWYKLSDLPTLKKTKHQEGTGESLAMNANKFYMVAPFMVLLKKWISQERKKASTKIPPDSQSAVPTVTDDLLTDEDGTRVNGNAFGTQTKMPTQTPSDLPEVSISRTGPEDPSIHLKRLLNLEPSSAPEAVAESKLPEVDVNKSNALLAFLRGASKPSVALQQPETPLEQVTFLPEVPRTPHHHQRPSPFSGMAPPPDFPIVTNASNVADRLQPDRPPVSHTYSTSANLPQAVNPMASLSEATALKASSAQYTANTTQKLDSYSADSRPFQSHGPAPYHRTGDPEFARPEFSGIHAPAIPPASNLPKLTSHTRALLDVFKSGSNAPPKLAEVSASPTHNPSFIGMFSKGTPTNSITQSQSSHSFPPIFQKLARRQHANDESTKNSHSQPSAHQANLLNLLKRPPGLQNPGSEIAELNTHGAVELATQATPSPKASKPAAYDLLSLLSQKVDTSKTSVPPRMKQNTSKIPQTSATVTGPLNMPHVQTMHKPHHRKQRSTNGPYKTPKQKSSNAPQHGSIKILPRPTTATSTPLSSPKLPQEPTSDVSPLSPPRRLETTSDQQKPFQPQILRRPQSRQRQRHSPSPSPLSLPADAPDHLVPNISPPQSAEEKPISAVISPMPVTSAHVPQTSVTPHVSDLPPGQPTDSHKQSLLSLFSAPKKSRDNSNTSTLRAPPSRESTILVSPLQEPTRHTHPNPPQLALRTSSISPPGRSRIGSLSSMVSRGAVGSTVGVRDEVSREATPTSARTTKADDRAFLMGYLERVARGEEAQVR